MDSLLSYPDSEVEESCVPTPETLKDMPSDFFGLNSSSGDEQLEETTKPCKLLDLLIESYQLDNALVGPSLQSGNLPSKNRAVFREQPVYLEGNLKGKQTNFEVTCSKIKRLKMTDNVLELQKPLVSDARCNPQRADFLVHPVVTQNASEASMPRVIHQVKQLLTNHRSCVNTLHWGPQLDSGHLLLSASMDGSVKLWDAFASKQMCTWSITAHDGAAVRCARWCPIKHSVASGGYDKAVRVYDIEQGVEVFSGQHRHFVFCLEFHPLIPHVMICGTLGGVECWDLRESSSKPCRSYMADCNEIQDVEFLRNGEEFLCSTNFVSRDSANRTIIVWDFRSKAILSNQIFHERYHCTSLRLHPFENSFVAQTNGNYIALFSSTQPYKMNKRRRFEGHKVEGYWIGCDFSNDGRYLYSASMDGQVYAYHFQSGRICRILQLSEQPCIAIACHPLLQSTVAVSDWAGVIHVCC